MDESLPEMIGRESDVSTILSSIAEGDCYSVVGMSNIGKSTLLRSLSRPHVRAKFSNSSGYIFVYVDLNLALQMTERGFYEAVLRNLLTALHTASPESRLVTAVQEAYQTVVAPSTPFLVPLAFENCLETVCNMQHGALVLLLDEFDETFSGIETHLFVRLRALRDKHGVRLCYVTATDHPLSEIRRDRQAGEFGELFEGHTQHLAPLSESDARELVNHWAVQAKSTIGPEDIGFVTERAGGHPGLIQAVCRVLIKSRDEALLRPTSPEYALVQTRLDSDPNVRLECAKLWSDLKARDQEALMALLDGEPDGVPGVEALVERGIVRTTADGLRVFARQFADFVRRQRMMRRPEPRGIRIDVEAGDVWVDGKLAPVLTDLEYKLLLLLYGNLGKICDKYKVVQSVWGEDYIDEVDDARIEKLVSRLREKIEPAVEEPKYVITVRGRGYKLISPE